MAVTVETLLVRMEARFDQYNRQLSAAQAATNRQLAGIEQRFAVASRSIRNSASTAAMGVTGALGSIGAALGTAAVVEYANAWTRVTRAIEAAQPVFGLALRSAQDLNALANDARVDVEAYTKLYIRTAAAIRDYSFEAGTAEKVTSTLAKALKLGGAAASEQASVLLQFSQALQKGKLDGDEFRSVMENAGIVQELLAKRLRVTKGQIVEMAAAGKLQIPDLVGAMVDGAEQVDRIYRQMPQTIDEAFAVLRNNVIQFIGEADKASDASQTLAAGIVSISQNLDKLAVVIGAILSAGAVRMLAFAGAVAAAANPVTLLAAAVGALATGFAIYGDTVKVTSDGSVSLRSATQALFETLGDTDALVAVTGILGDISRGVIGYAQAFAEWAAKAARAIGDVLGLTGPAEAFFNRVEQRAREIEMRRAVAAKDFGRGMRLAQAGLLPDTTPRPVPPPTAAVDKDKLRRADRFARDLIDAENRIEAARLEADLIGRSAEEAERLRVRQELINEARREGVALSEGDLIKIDAISIATARAVTETEMLQQAYADLQSTSEEMLQGFIRDLREGTSATEALGNALNRIADRLIDMAVNDLVQGALGGLTGRGGDAQGAGLASAVSSLLGFADGGVFVPGQGPRPLKRFANGGISRQAAIFGEAGPEAAVPLPDGRSIPVNLRMPPAAMSGPTAVSVNVAPVFHVQNGTTEGVSRLNAETVPMIQGLVRKEVGQLFDRNRRFAKSGI